MMTVIESGESLSIVLEEAIATNEVRYDCGISIASGALFVQAQSQAGSTTGTTPKVIVAGAAAQEKRINGLNIYNQDTVTHFVVVSGASTFPRNRIKLLPKWSWEHGVGTFDDTGQLQQVTTLPSVLFTTLSVPLTPGGILQEFVLSYPGMLGTETITCWFDSTWAEENDLEEIQDSDLRVYAKSEPGQIRFYLASDAPFVGDLAIDYRKEQ